MARRYDDFVAVLDELFEHRAQRKDFWCAVDERDHDDAEGRLHLRVLEELVEHDLRLDIALEFDDDAHAVAVGFVAQVGDVFDRSCCGTRSAIFSIRLDLLT